MKKTLSVILVIFSLFSLSGCIFNVKLPEEKATEPQDVNEVIENPYTFLDLYIYSEYRSEYADNYDTLYSGKRDFITLDEEGAKKYPRLFNALKKFNAEELDSFETTTAEYISWAREMYEEGYGYSYEYSSESDIFVQRADETVVSLLQNYHDYMGGAHGMYGNGGVNFNTETGEELLLSDVCTDIAKLGEIVYNKLKEDYPDAYFFDLESVIENSVIEESFAWTINNTGVNIYFQPYEIASFADGSFTVTLPFKQYPDLFNPKFTDVPDSYVMALPSWGYEFDLDEYDNTSDYINYYFREDEYACTGVDITVNDESYTFDNLFFYDATVYLVHTEHEEKENNYLMMHITSENDYESTLIFSLEKDNVGLIQELYGVGLHKTWDNYYATLVPLDPYNIKMDTIVDCLSTLNGYKHYFFDPYTASLTAKEKYYTIETEHTLTSKTDIEVIILSTGKKEVIPKGETFSFLRTDNETYVDFKISGNRECRIMVNLDEWPHLVNGVEEYDCFDEIMYAG